MSDRMEQLIREHRLIPPGSTVLCAVSGGADSVYLLHRLYGLRRELDFTLVAAHYDHRLRGAESTQDAKFVEEFVRLCCPAERLYTPQGPGKELPEVALITGGGDVAGEAARLRQGLEETARQMRYAFLQQAAEQAGADLIATAHNASDNAETVLLHLGRGSGLRGLAGMPPKRGNLIRPLLTTSREEIETYLRYRGLPWREDATNRDDAYARNRLRHQVLPVLEDLFPGFLSRMGQTCAHLREDEDYLSSLAAQAVACARREGEDLILPAAALADQPQSVAIRGARMLIGSMRAGNDNCAAPHLEGLLELCRGSDPSARLDLPGGLTARRRYEELVLSRSAPTPLSPRELNLAGETRAGDWRVRCLPGTYQGERQSPLDCWLAQNKAPMPTLRPRRTGDTLAPPGRHGKSVKKWMIDTKIPACCRDSVPVVDAGGKAAAVALLGPHRDFVPQKGQLSWHITFVPPDYLAR